MLEVCCLFCLLISNFELRAQELFISLRYVYICISHAIIQIFYCQLKNVLLEFYVFLNKCFETAWSFLLEIKVQCGILLIWRKFESCLFRGLEFNVVRVFLGGSVPESACILKAQFTACFEPSYLT